MKIQRFDHIVITVKDINATISFYTKVLNMRVLTLRGKGIEIKALQFGNQRINIHESNKKVEPEAINPTPGSVDICLVTDSPIADVVSHLKKNNILIEKEPMVVTGALGEMESVWFRDPDGNLIEVAKYPI